MASGLGGLILAAAIAAASGSAARGDLTTFDPQRDAHDVGRCFSTYQTLAELAVELKPARRRDYYDRLTAEGSRRLKPFVRESVQIVGERDFFWRASGEHEALRTVLRSKAGRHTEVVKSFLILLEVEAAMCDQRVASWGAPVER